MNALNSQTFHMNQILNIKQLVEITGLSRATIYSLLDLKSGGVSKSMLTLNEAIIDVKKG